MKVFHDPIAQETIIEYDERFFFFELPIQIQKYIISNFFSLQTRGRFAQISQHAKLLCYELTYDYPFNKTCTQKFLINPFILLNEKTNSLIAAKKTTSNCAKLNNNYFYCRLTVSVFIISELIALPLSILGFIYFSKSQSNEISILSGIIVGSVIAISLTTTPDCYKYAKKKEQSRRENKVKKLDNETHHIKLSLIQELSKEPKLKNRAESILKTMNFKG